LKTLILLALLIVTSYTQSPIPEEGDNTYYFYYSQDAENKFIGEADKLHLPHGKVLLIIGRDTLVINRVLPKDILPEKDAICYGHGIKDYIKYDFDKVIIYYHVKKFRKYGL